MRVRQPDSALVKVIAPVNLTVRTNELLMLPASISLADTTDEISQTSALQPIYVKKLSGGLTFENFYIRYFMSRWSTGYFR